MKQLTLTITALLLSLLSFAQAPAPITGPTTICNGTTGTLTDATSGGTWSLTPLTVAAIGSATGIVTGISAGVVSITYTTSGGSAYYTVTVNPLPAVITGPSTVCVGGTIALADITPGGTWSTSSISIVTMGVGGLLTGVTAGVATITYTITTGCYTAKSITVNTTPGAISGPSSMCLGGTPVTLSCPGGGVWSAGSGIVTVGSTTGVVTSVAAGVATITYTAGSACTSTLFFTVNPVPSTYTLTGGGSYCTGGSGSMIGLSNSTPGVSYQLYLSGTPIGTAVAGTGSPISFGLMTTTGTYTAVGTIVATGCTANMTGSVTVGLYPLPTAYTVTGGGAYCSGGPGVHVGLSGSNTGINYQLYNGASPVGLPIVGTGSSLDFGLQTAAGTYTVVGTNAVTACSANMTGSVTISITTPVTPSVSITPSPGTTICTGTAATFTAVATGGGPSPSYQWSINGTVITGATSSTFVTTTLVTGDIVAVLMTSSATCVTTSTASASVTMTVDVPSISASSTPATCGGSYTLTGSGGVSYLWAPSTGLSCSTCGSTTITPASTTVYTVTGTDGTGCTGTGTVSVDGNRISGYITYTGVITDIFKVWLIHYNPIDSSITALDSTLSCMDAGTPYYQFMDPPAGDYMVKAKLNGTIPGTSGYIPTYSLSTANWYSGATVTHAAAKDTMHINMVYGTVPAGPGFISGYVYSGAGKGTAGDVPEPGMLVYLEDGTGHILTYTYTDVTGYYSFGSLANGSYIIYPEAYKYYTTPSAIITLTPSYETSGLIDFKKHTTFGTITPNTTSVVSCAGPIHMVYPNPAQGILNIVWDDHNTEDVTVNVTDMTGRNVFHSVFSIDAKQIKTQVDMSVLQDGVYFISINSADINYSGKLLIAK